MALLRPTRGRLAALLAALTLVAAPVHAQATGRVAGKVSAEGGIGLPAATVQVVGQPLGTFTRNDGTYSLSLRPGSYTLRFRLIGYKSETAQVTVTSGQTSTVNATLDRQAANLEAVAVVGTRDKERTVTQSPVPVDVFSAAELRATGRTETAQMIQAVAPSFNFPRTAIADGTDANRPATLRGLGADQVLVLVNGKRRHTSALINVNGTIGRGQAAVDLNAIPASMIERIEVLRDGAAAQYGSDAIAGVINIVLKKTAPTELSLQGGLTALGDGGNIVGSVNGGRQWGQQSYLHVGAEVRDRGFTDRSSGDFRTQFGATDPRELTANRLTHRHGDAISQDIVGMFTAGTQLGATELYAFGGLGRREAQGVGFWRLPLSAAQTVPALNPNGFLPKINSTLWDASAVVGAKGKIAGFQWDLSQTLGRNSHNFFITNTNNASFGPASPTEFNSGTLVFSQGTTNLDLFRAVDIGVPLRVAFGAEYRRDQYEIEAGEPMSWQNGGRDRFGNVSATPAGAGAQVFPGFRPTDAKNVSRSNTSLYLDLESDLAKWLLVGAAVRTEDYSDFGRQTTGKGTFRFAPVKWGALRGAYATGFRAPSLQQNWFTATSTNFIGGVPFDIRTFAVASREAQLLGARPLQPETSTNSSIGVTLTPTSALTVTVDAYDIRIDDRIVLSDNFIGQGIRDFFAANGITGIGGGRFFTNAIDTKTRGLDAVTSWARDFRGRGLLRLNAGFSRNYTTVTAVKQVTPPQLGNLDEVLFSRVERARIEIGQPRSNVILSASHEVSKFTFNVRTQRFGEVTVRNPTAVPPARQVPDQTFSAKWITDVSLGLALRPGVQFTMGADNVFDVYPDQNSDLGDIATNYSGNSNFGIFRFNGISPFGFNGRFAYARVNVRF